MSERPLSETGERLLIALWELEREEGKRHYPASATDLAYKAGLGQDVRRHGDGAKGGGSYTGWQSPGFVMGGACSALVRRKYAWQSYGRRSMSWYFITVAGRREAERLIAAGVTAKGGRVAP